MFAEDLSIFFNPVTGFAVAATWKRAADDVVANVLIDEATREVFDDIASADDREMRYPRDGAFAQLTEGEIIEVGGARYKVRPPRLEGDGAIVVVALARVP